MKNIITIVLTIFITGVSVALYMFVTRPTDISNLDDAKQAVSKHYILPTDEEPALLTVIKKEQVSSEYLRNKVEDGDKILIYKNNQKVMIYRPSIDKLVDVGPAAIEQPTVKSQ